MPPPGTSWCRMSQSALPTERLPDAGRVAVPPRRDGRRRRGHGRPRRRPRDPVRRRRRASPPATSARAWTTCPTELEAKAAGPEDPDRRRQRQPDRLALRPEPDQRPAQPDLAEDGQGDRRDRGLPLLRARRARPQGHAARLRHQPGQGGVGPGWLVDHPADGQADPAQPGRDQGGARGRHRRHLRPQAPRAALRDRLRGEVLQGLDPRALPQHRLLRRRRLRHPVGRPALLLQERQRTSTCAQSATARRAGQEPDRLRPDQLPRRAPLEPPQRRARPDGPAQRDHREARPSRLKEPQARPRRSSRRANGCVSSPGRRSSATTSSTT